MPKIKVEVGLTLKMASGGGYNFFRPLISIEDIDPEGDVEAQIEVSIPALKVLWSAVESEMVSLVERSEVAEYETILIELRKQMEEFEDRLLNTEQLTAALEPTDNLNWSTKKKAGKKK